MRRELAHNRTKTFTESEQSVNILLAEPNHLVIHTFIFHRAQQYTAGLVALDLNSHFDIKKKYLQNFKLLSSIGRPHKILVEKSEKWGYQGDCHLRLFSRAKWIFTPNSWVISHVFSPHSRNISSCQFLEYFLMSLRLYSQSFCRQVERGKAPAGY